ncbi:MAG TPA: hypothetical protein VK900_05935 [Anaerolineales bacterium]|nr:hypothetical protein [Anaerolineales bacterium]
MNLFLKRQGSDNPTDEDAGQCAQLQPVLGISIYDPDTKTQHSAYQES